MSGSRGLSAETHWQPVPGAELYWKILEDEIVVYNDLSGHTHILDPVAALIVQKLVESPRNGQQLLADMRGSLAIDPDQDISATLESALWRLAELGLVEVELH